MKLIQALKQIKDLKKKADDLAAKVKLYCAYPSFEQPVYKNQTAQVQEWMQAYSDIVQEIEKLRCAIQYTNLVTPVTIKLGDNQITKSIAAWIHRRRDLAGMDGLLWACLTDKNIKEGQMKSSTGELVEVKIVRCYSPEQRDTKRELYRSEPSLIDGELEIINAITDLVYPEDK